MKKITFQFLILFVVGLSPAFAQSGIILSDKSGWHRIGSKSVDFARDKDEIPVVLADRFAAIKFKVTKAAIQLNQLEITFESGDAQIEKINSEIASPGQTRIIDIKGSERNIKKIIFTYRTLPNYKGKKAEVEFWGLKTNVDQKKGNKSKKLKNTKAEELTPPTASISKNQTKSSPEAVLSAPAGSSLTGQNTPENRSQFGVGDTSRVMATTSVITSDKTGWHKIGSRTVDFSSDRDEILVTGANRFTSIKFKATDAPIHFMAIKLNYDKDDVQEFALNAQLDPGKESVDISLDRGLERDLKRISFVYKTVPNFKDTKATIEIWGYKTNNSDSKTDR